MRALILRPVSTKIANTYQAKVNDKVKLRLPFLRSMASCISLTTSLPTAPSHTKPLVHVTSSALSSPRCLVGKLNVNPSPIFFPMRSWSKRKSCRQPARKSKSSSAGPCISLLLTYESWRLRYSNPRFN